MMADKILSIVLSALIVLCHVFIQCKGLSVHELTDELPSLDRDDTPVRSEKMLIDTLLAELDQEDPVNPEHEQVFDDVYIAPATDTCKDKTTKPRYCRRIRKLGHCWDRQGQELSMEWCANTCGHCNCKNSEFNCCPDQKTKADGPDRGGCSRKLCYDVRVEYCKKIKEKGLCKSKGLVSIKPLEDCSWSCGQCHHAAPAKVTSPHGYCWDGTAALGPDNKGCRECMDYTPTICTRWGSNHCNTGSFQTSKFMRGYCPATCDYCGACYNRIGLAKCRGYKKFCSDPSWREKLKRDCAQFCRLC